MQFGQDDPEELSDTSRTSEMMHHICEWSVGWKFDAWPKASTDFVIFTR